MDKPEILDRLDIPNFYQEFVPSLKPNGKPELLGLCPFHNDHNPSLSVNGETGLHHCHACGAGGDIFSFYMRFKGVDFPTALREIGKMAGVVDTSDIRPKVVATFKYYDSEGKLLYLKERIEPGRNGRNKEFVFKHLKNGKWMLGRGGDPILYNLPEVMKSKNVIAVEGEGKADLLNSWGFTATCLDSGANSPWKDGYLDAFEGKEMVVILPDNDKPGREYATKIANALYGKVKELKVVELPGLQEKEDIIDWVKIPGTDKSKLLELVENTSQWIPTKEQKTVTSDLTQQRQYTGDKNPRPIFEPLLEVEIFKQGKHLIFLNEQIHMYEDGWYQPFDDRHYLKLLELQIKDFLNGRRGVAKEILETLKDSLHKKEQPANINPKLINVKNGLFNIETGELLPHSPDYVYTYQINANYDHYATCQTFEKFLSEILIDEETLETDEELLLLMQQFIGYCLYSATPFHESLMFFGDGRNGKGLLVFVVKSLFKGLTSNVHFEDIGLDRFATADLSGKLVNISSEFGANAQLHDGQIKAIIGGDELRAQRKHQQPFDFRPFAKHIITTNNLPRSRDKSLGFFSRFTIVPFNRTFLKQEDIDELDDIEFKATCSVRDPFLEEKLTRELDGIFLWAVNGLKNLFQDGGFVPQVRYENIVIFSKSGRRVLKHSVKIG